MEKENMKIPFDFSSSGLGRGGKSIISKALLPTVRLLG